MRILLTIALALPAVALAEPPCDRPLTGAEWREALGWVDRYFGEEDLKRAQRMLTWTHAHLPCLTEVVHPTDLARFAHQSSFQATLDEDPEQARAWAQLAMVAAPQTPLPDWMPASHTGRVAIATVDPPQMVNLDTSIAHPRGGGVFLDGRFLRQPVAAAEVPHLVQIGDRRGRIETGHWQHGLAFRDEVLDAAADQATPPGWWTPPTTRTRDDYVPVSGAGDARRKRFTIAGILGGAAAGMYGLSWASRAAYEGSYSNGLYATTNGTVVASGLAGSAAVGALVAALATPGGR